LPCSTLLNAVVTFAAAGAFRLSCQSLNGLRPPHPGIQVLESPCYMVTHMIPFSSRGVVVAAVVVVIVVVVVVDVVIKLSCPLGLVRVSERTRV
jgi:hypothetical protein